MYDSIIHERVSVCLCVCKHTHVRVSIRAHAPTYPQAKVKKEEDVEGHIDLQREVFVEVLAGFYRTREQRKRQKKIIIRLNPHELIQEGSSTSFLPYRVYNELRCHYSPNPQFDLTFRFKVTIRFKLSASARADKT